jgi:hypothetical protein
MTKTLEQIEEGDRVWLGDQREPRRVLRTVEKLTPKQIVLTIRNDRYKRDTFRSVCNTGLRLTGVATPEEVEQWEAEQARLKVEAEARLAERRRINAKRLELTGLFGEGFYVSESNDPDTPPWEVHGFLSEEGVRKLAEMLQGVVLGTT